MPTTNQFTITRKIELDAAHRVPHHHSKCFNIHGHRYVVEARCVGDLIKEGSQVGMVMDFAFLKMLMMDVIHGPADHACIFWKFDPIVMPLRVMPSEELEGWKLYIMDMVPTAENLAHHWHTKLEKAIHEWCDEKLIKPVTLESLTVWETPNCKASYPW